jgi:hypothetical protein
MLKCSGFLFKENTKDVCQVFYQIYVILNELSIKIQYCIWPLLKYISPHNISYSENWTREYIYSKVP